ncbi:PREDICTED: toll-like receptor 5 isoform X2 [Poecilia mexicana]|uniref:toll-like receptor 5 isoform X2 n=1 Tax=Poecilia mexicana TaxID=48701 RepID=UPI00072D967C|nr:PREDICTED: toll-like receptor 5 isoform X2 [Poecilia mexicana]
MWLLVLQLICAGFYLQLATCHPSCQLWGQKAYCTSRNLSWVPVLPPNLTHLYLDINLIHEINRTSLRDLKELQELDLGSQKVVLTIRNDSFLRQRKLTTLVLGGNVGLKLEPRAFVGLVRLRDLWLDYCSLTDSILAENYLKPLLSLEKLNLYGNNIVRLNPDGWCLEAFTLAQGRMLEELTNVLVMLVVGKVAHYQLMKCNAVRAFVQRREYLTWPKDPQDLEWFYERLVSLILRDTKVKKFAEDKPETVKPDCQPPAKEKIPLENIRVNNLAGNPLM